MIHSKNSIYLKNTMYVYCTRLYAGKYIVLIVAKQTHFFVKFANDFLPPNTSFLCFLITATIVKQKHYVLNASNCFQLEEIIPDAIKLTLVSLWSRRMFTMGEGNTGVGYGMFLRSNGMFCPWINEFSISLLSFFAKDHSKYREAPSVQQHLPSGVRLPPHEI